jgi:hypothetical protein
MQSYLCIGGDHDGLNYPAHADAETIEWPVCITGRETYKRLTLSLGDVSTTIYIHESLRPEEDWRWARGKRAEFRRFP